MIGIDVARVKRWFVKYYPQFSSTAYRIELNLLSVTAIDPNGGIDATYLITAYDSNNDGVFWSRGKYNRKHYGGWSVEETSHSET